MSGPYLSPGLFPRDLLRRTVQFIRDSQCASGEIPWFPGNYTDPWDHVEAAMGLTIGGEVAAAERAYAWLAARQLEHGTSWAPYRGELPDNLGRVGLMLLHIPLGLLDDLLGDSVLAGDLDGVTCSGLAYP